MSEEQINRKQYYRNLIDPTENRHPIEVLGELYFKENQKEIPDLSYIRFAQGEIYFLAQDYETAIFKWEEIRNELSAWAKKNTADALYELEMYGNAEEIYKNITSDSMILNMEVLKKLFLLYEQEGKHDLAVETIKKAVEFNPEYENVTTLAKSFFENKGDWHNAFDLAVSETLRTKREDWVKALIEYIENGHAENFQPDYFSTVLSVALEMDERLFEKLAVALWKTYQQEESYFAWIKEVTGLIENSEAQKKSWQELSALFAGAYKDLLGGKYFIKDVMDVIPRLVTTWAKLANHTDAAFASSAVLAWNQQFLNSIPISIVNEAEKQLYQSSKNSNMFTDGINLFHTIVKWAEAQKTVVSPRLKTIVSRLEDLQTHNILLVGGTEAGKNKVLNRLVGGKNISSASTTGIFTHNDSSETVLMSDSEIWHDVSREDLTETNINSPNNWFIDKKPNRFLGEFNFAILNSTNQNGLNKDLLNMADCVLFLVNEQEPFMERDRKLLLEIQKEKPDLPFHLLVINDSLDYTEKVNNMSSIISSYFPQAKRFHFMKFNDSWEHLHDLGEFITGCLHESFYSEERAEKILYFIRQVINGLQEKRREAEKDIVDSISSNQKLVSKLNGAINQLLDVKDEKVEKVTRSYESIKEAFRKDIMTSLPKILKECAEIVNEESDFNKIHIQLNEEMNKRIRRHIESAIIPEFLKALDAWVDSNEIEFKKAQLFLEEMSAGFNSMFQTERMSLICDFKVLEDWRRDATRFTNKIYLKDVNIFLRKTPSQLLLKGTGKLLSVLAQNKLTVVKRYKQAVEHENYLPVVERIAEMLLQPFELLENGLAGDVAKFFEVPETVLNDIVNEIMEDTTRQQERLKVMEENPESYNDPLTVFKLRLIQNEWIILAGRAFQLK